MIKNYRVGIVGAGLIGNKRASALEAAGGARLVAVAEIDRERAKKFAAEHRCEVVKSWRELVRRPDVDIVIVAVPNKFAKPIVTGALARGKQVLCEKPFGRNFKEASAMLAEAKKWKRLVKVGFNHRFHPAIFEAKKLFDSGFIGRVLFIRAKYGHGGRLGMEKEWRFQKQISGGGELLDQGVHLIDLARWFAGDFKEVLGIADTKFWPTKLDDNAFTLLRKGSVTAMLHVSTTNWKNTFAFEVFGEKGFLIVDGLGRSYGQETLTIGKRKPEFGVPDVETKTYTEDTSWTEEWKNFLSALRGKAKLIGDAHDGAEANRYVEAVYESTRRKRFVKL